MALNYLIDENVNPIYTIQLRRLNLDLFILAVGDLTTPQKGTLDPEILIWCEENNFVLVTNNRKSMPVHLTDHIAQGHHIPGIFILNPKLSVGENIEQLLLIAEGSLDNEYQDRIKFLPIV
ncbi:DUF5615 family PIN-like protein [Sphaerospermopsis kisseleviana CS-549]|jgi:hypothetical protein|uniref:DUF5615 family PIN-like protein n=1 Tax=Sphaerospermopsis kisseleviana CS-549 TaxID=3021783 RepID=A0ABT4ZP60_9CYAN|nr:DUF5615 family PIN-like protein [Sphaerospermopsis kisseleviana]MDB9441192.1 DUF5615 family PIN-like protein [Sphaerospermopsis kisseleviana CS-549]BAZ81752.1 hypothetical protein NIES73_30200 [Sphaerospermopsis kisseleviana NIES-73]